MLEATPVAPLVASHPSYKARATTQIPVQASSTSASTKKQSPKKPKQTKLPPRIAALPENQRPPVDPERWLPKRERKGFAAVLEARAKEKEKKRLKARKKLEASMTQGSATAANDDGGRAATPTTGASGASKGKKKKGGR